ncbi:MAG: acyl-CoA thioesterase [Calditrichia bacterium]
MKPSISKLTVRSYECDSYGHVNNATYVNYLEFGRMELLHRRGITLKALKEAGVMVLIRQIEIVYHLSAEPGDELYLNTSVKSNRKVGGVFEQVLRRSSDDRLVVKADVTWVCVNLKGRPCRIPEVLQAALGLDSPIES